MSVNVILKNEYKNTMWILSPETADIIRILCGIYGCENPYVIHGPYPLLIQNSMS